MSTPDDTGKLLNEAMSALATRVVEPVDRATRDAFNHARGLAMRGHGRSTTPGSSRRAGQHHLRRAMTRALAAVTRPVEDAAEEVAS